MAKSADPNLAAAISTTFPARALKAGTAWIGPGPDLFSAIDSASKPEIVIDENPGPAMQSMKTTIDAVQTAGLREKVKIMVGGPPVTQQYTGAIGADGYGESAGASVALARKLVAV